jgi:acetyltransferase-like isoleucine patch superfamily enzyme
MKNLIGKNVIIHETSFVEDGVIIGDNVNIGPFCLIKKGASIGNDCKFTSYCEIRENVKIGSGTTMGSRCTISANAIIGDNVIIKYGFVLTDTPDLTKGFIKNVKGVGDNTKIGANVTLMPGFQIGKNCVIGACSQIRSDINDNEVWYGSPAKFYKKNE